MAINATNSDDRLLGAIAHLSIFFLAILLPIVLWAINKDKPGKEWLARQAKQALVYQIAVIVGSIALMVALFILTMFTMGIGGLLGMVVFPLYGIAVVIIAILATVRAYHGEDYRYPITGGLFQ